MSLFAEPRLLFFLLLVPLLVLVFVLAERRRSRQLRAMTSPDRTGSVLGAGFERRLLFLILLCLGLCFLAIAAARPQWGTRMEELSARGIDIMIAIDVSESMKAADVEPSRIARARQVVHKFLDKLSGDRVGLIGFAGSAYTFVPLTVDYGAFRLFADTLAPGDVADQGTDIGSAIDEAIRAFERAESDAARVLVVFSDGEHHEEDPLPAVKRAADKGIQIFTIGIGNPNKSGERIPLRDAAGNITYKVDQADNLVITKLDEATLEAVAEEGNGAYYRVSDAGTELAQIYRSVEEQQEVAFASRALRLREDRFQIPLLIALVLTSIAYSLGSRSFRNPRRTRGVTS